MRGPIRARIGLLMVAALGIVLLSINAFAAVVTNTNDNGPGSLREALLMTPAGGMIEFSLSNCPCTIALTSGELLIDKDLMVNGPGAEMLTISAGGNQFRVMRIEGTEGFRYIKVEIAGLRIADGSGHVEKVYSLT